jgi:hypothetical protein
LSVGMRGVATSTVTTALQKPLRRGMLRIPPLLRDLELDARCPFYGKASEDVNAHLQHFLEICNTFTIQGVT